MHMRRHLQVAKKSSCQLCCNCRPEIKSCETLNFAKAARTETAEPDFSRRAILPPMHKSLVTSSRFLRKFAALDRVPCLHPRLYATE